MIISFPNSHFTPKFLRLSPPMALLHFRPPSISPNLSFPPGPRRLRFSTAALSVKSAIVWYKHDLRVEDHPGLVAASKHPCVVPLYIFDRRILSRYSDEMLELLLFALEDLKKLLRKQGSDLMVRFGSAESVIRELTKEVQATSIIIEEEVEYELRVMIDVVKESLTNVPQSGVDPKIVTWSTPFYDITSLKDSPASYDDFKKLKLPVVSAIEPPKLTAHAMNQSWGSLPTLAELNNFMEDNSDVKTKRKWTSVKQFSAASVLQQKKLKGNFTLKEEKWKEDILLVSGSKANQRTKLENSAFVTSQGSLVGGGASLVLNALAAYLRYLEGTARYDFQEVHEKLRLAEKREGASFPALFGAALLLGIISRRRVYFEAIKYEKERNGGFISPFGYSTTTVASAIDSVSSMEWYWLLALKGLKSDTGKFSRRTWRWNNYLIQYTVAGCEGPAVLLVHGFGAFLDHYRDNIYPIAEVGNRVWAVTLLGFGKSEKPNITYTELVWAELLRDFIVEVVGEPVHLVGNSIGGYSVAIAAGLWSSLAKSVVLMNSAGNIVPAYSASGFSEERQTSGLAWLGARLLSPYLRFNLKNILKSFYPTKPDRADDQLIQEMLRSSHDPGVIFVLESIFSFDLSLPLNYLLEDFEDKTLVIQGMKDPLSDSKSTLAMFREHCRGVLVKEIDAGHCPHDELPNEVNAIITQWVATVESKTSPVTSQQFERY